MTGQRVDFGGCGPSICAGPPVHSMVLLNKFGGSLVFTPSDLESKSQFLAECLARVSVRETQSAARSCGRLKGAKILPEFESAGAVLESTSCNEPIGLKSAWRDSKHGLSPGHKRVRRASPLSDLVTCEAVTRRSNGRGSCSGTRSPTLPTERLVTAPTARFAHSNLRCIGAYHNQD